MTERDPRLFIWPKGADPRKVAAVKQAVIDLGLPYVVKPFWYAVESSEDAKRVLVLEDGFENSPVIDYIYPKKSAMVQEAVEWALGIRPESRGAHLALDTMKSIFGEELTVHHEGAAKREEGPDGS